MPRRLVFQTILLRSGGQSGGTLLTVCHPELRKCFAKRSIYGVEGARFASSHNRRVKEFSRQVWERGADSYSGSS